MSVAPLRLCAPAPAYIVLDRDLRIVGSHVATLQLLGSYPRERQRLPAHLEARLRAVVEQWDDTAEHVEWLLLPNGFVVRIFVLTSSQGSHAYGLSVELHRQRWRDLAVEPEEF